MSDKSLTIYENKTSTGLGNTYDIEGDYSGYPGGVVTEMSFVVSLGGTANATSVSVSIEGSIDSKFWQEYAHHDLSVEEITDGGALFHIVNKPLSHIRGKLDAVVGGTNPTVTVKMIGR